MIKALNTKENSNQHSTFMTFMTSMNENENENGNMYIHVLNDTI